MFGMPRSSPQRGPFHALRPHSVEPALDAAPSCSPHARCQHYERRLSLAMQSFGRIEPGGAAGGQIHGQQSHAEKEHQDGGEGLG